MKAWTLGPQDGLKSLSLVEKPIPEPVMGEALIRVEAACLNHRDLLILRGQYGARKREDCVALSDGVGVIEKIEGASHGLSPGQRVIAPHFVQWTDGPYSPSIFARDLGVTRDGWLAGHICLPAQSLVPVPDGMLVETAATLAAAGTTVWHAISVFAKTGPGDLVLAPGTGGVSIFALQLAKALGASVAITSSSDEKLERCRALGADHCINYAKRPDWAAALLEATGGRGADVIVDTIGLSQIEQTLAAAAPNARIALIGGLAGTLGHAPNMSGLIGKNITLKGLTSGSRAMLADLVALVARTGIRPPIEARFDFDSAPEALAALDQARHIGKIMISA